MKNTPKCVCAYLALLVLAAGLSGCQIHSTCTAAGNFERLQSVHALAGARSAVENGGRATEEPNDYAPVSAGPRRIAALTSNRTQGRSDLLSVDSNRPLSVALHYDKPAHGREPSCG